MTTRRSEPTLPLAERIRDRRIAHREQETEHAARLRAERLADDAAGFVEANEAYDR